MTSLVRVGIVAIVLFSDARALQGLVLDTAGRPLRGVEVRTSWNAAADTTDSVGMWFVAGMTGIVEKDGVWCSWTRKAVNVRLESAAPLRLDAFDASGRSGMCQGQMRHHPA